MLNCPIHYILFEINIRHIKTNDCFRGVLICFVSHWKRNMVILMTTITDARYISGSVNALFIIEFHPCIWWAEWHGPVSVHILAYSPAEMWYVVLSTYLTNGNKIAFSQETIPAIFIKIACMLLFTFDIPRHSHGGIYAFHDHLNNYHSETLNWKLAMSILSLQPIVTPPSAPAQWNTWNVHRGRKNVNLKG